MANEPIKRLMEILEVSGPAGPRPAPCGGALLRIDDQAKWELEKSGIMFESAVRYGERQMDARVGCRGSVEPRGERGEYARGLCTSCSKLESDVREMMRARMGGGT